MSSAFRKIIYGVSPNTPAPDFKVLLQWHLFLRVIILTVLLGISVILQTKTHGLAIPRIGYIAYFISGIYLFTMFSAILLRSIGNYRQFSLFQTIFDALLATVIVYTTGGSQSVFTIIYFLPILAGAFMLLRLGGLLIAAICTMSYGFILFVEMLYQPMPFTGFASQLNDIIVAMHFFAIHGLVFFIIAILSLIIFERMRTTESALTQSTLNYDRLEILYKQIFDDINTGIITVDNEGLITSFNQSAEQMSGFNTSEVLGRSIHGLFPGLKKRDSLDLPRLTTELTRKDGSVIPAGYSWARLNLPGDYDNCRVYTIQDLSQIRDMEKQVKQSEKMATIGEMAAGIAHEFRNPLAAISGAAQVLHDELSSEAASSRLINIVARESDRLEGTINDFLLFSKPSEPAKEWFKLKSLTEKTIQMLEQGHKLKANICRSRISIPEELDAWADPRHIQQILLNLIANACQALGEKGGEITIAAAEKEDGKGKGVLVIKVVDDGPGIEPSVLPMVFEPFFTTRESGTGLGLAIVRQLVESHDGTIVINSSKGERTEFTVTLPCPHN